MIAVAILALTSAVSIGAHLALRPAPRRVRARRRRRRKLSRVHAELIVATTGAIVLVAFFGPFGVLFGGALLAAARVARRRGHERRRRAAIDEALPHAVELLVITVRAGLSPIDAVRAVGAVVEPPAGHGFHEVVMRLERGQRLADALGALPDVLGPGAIPIADGIAAADRYGTPLAPVLDRLAVEARDARRRAAEARARTLPVRLSFPLVCCTLPSFVLMAIVPALLGTLSSLRGTSP